MRMFWSRKRWGAWRGEKTRIGAISREKKVDSNFGYGKKDYNKRQKTGRKVRKKKMLPQDVKGKQGSWNRNEVTG